VTETPPSLRVVRGEPTAEELAALVVVLTARAAAAEPPARPQPAWADPAGRLPVRRRPLPGPPRRGPDSWRRSALPW